MTSVIVFVIAIVPVSFPWVSSKAALNRKDSVFDMAIDILLVISRQRSSWEVVSVVIIRSLGCAVEVQVPEERIEGINICLVRWVVGNPFRACSGFTEETGIRLFI